MPRHRYVVDEAAFTALLALEDAEIAVLLSAIESLAEIPFVPADHYSLDRQGRRLSNKVFGNFLITYWNDPKTRTLYILGIDRLDI